MQAGARGLYPYLAHETGGQVHGGVPANPCKAQLPGDVQNAGLAVEVTLQPVRRFDLDAAIIFSDILLPLEKMGAALAFSDAGGPVIERPVRSKEDVDRLRALDIEEDLPYVLKAIEQTRAELDGTVPLIGFSGAPFTLASYLIEGGGSKHYQITKTLMHTETRIFDLLMNKLTDMAIDYLNAQANMAPRPYRYSTVGSGSFRLKITGNTCCPI